MDGIINVKKEKGFTSHDVVAKLRGILHQKKIGHTGTLDPDATGVLPVCIGRATKVCGLLTDKRKTYIAEVQLGVVTDTQDMTGALLQKKDVCLSREQLQQVVDVFVGEISQVPPMYSAVKVNGKRLYELARNGEEIERKPRTITIYNNQLLSYDEKSALCRMEVECSKGTYIRTLCHDMGEKLGCGAAMASLVRTRVDRFLLEEAYTISQIEEIMQKGDIEKILVPLETVFDAYPKVVVENAGMRYLLNGNPVSTNVCRMSQMPEDGALVRMMDEKDNFYAVYRYKSRTDSFTNHKIFYNQVRIN